MLNYTNQNDQFNGRIAASGETLFLRLTLRVSVLPITNAANSLREMQVQRMDEQTDSRMELNGSVLLMPKYKPFKFLSCAPNSSTAVTDTTNDRES